MQNSIHRRCLFSHPFILLLIPKVLFTPLCDPANGILGGNIDVSCTNFGKVASSRISSMSISNAIA